MAVDLECTGINELADRLNSIWVTLDYLLRNGLGTSIVAIDSHCGEDGHANNLREKVLVRFTVCVESVSGTVVHL